MKFREVGKLCEIRQNKKYSLKPMAKRVKRNNFGISGKTLFLRCLLVAAILMLGIACLYLAGKKGGAIDHSLGLTETYHPTTHTMTWRK
jgi:hypothetical protein